MQSVNNAIVLVLAIWMLSRLIGVHEIVSNILANRKAKRQAGSLYRILLAFGTKQEISAFIYDYRNHLELNELDKLLEKMNGFVKQEQEERKSRVENVKPIISGSGVIN